MRKYDIDGVTKIKLALKVSDNCPNCKRKHVLSIRDSATIICLLCRGTFNRWIAI
jgi:hypothetical protein